MELPAQTIHSPHGRRPRELWVHAAGWLLAGTLAWAGLRGTADARSLGELAQLRIAGEVAALAEVNWRAALERWELPFTPASPSLPWREEAEEAPAAPRAEEAQLEEPRSAGSPAPPSSLSLLLDEAASLEREGDYEEALRLVQEGERLSPEDPEQPEAWLRILRLGNRLDREPLVRSTWRQVAGELDPRLQREGRPYLLLCALAAAPALSPTERRDAGRLVVRAWAEGALGPLGFRDEIIREGEPIRLVHRPDPRRATWLSALEALLPRSEWPPQLQAEGARLRLNAYRRFVGSSGFPQVLGSWRAWIGADYCWLARRDSQTQGRAFVVARPTFEKELRRIAELPEGFSIIFAEKAQPLAGGNALRSPRPLPWTQAESGALTYTLVHGDPASLRRPAERRGWLLRGTLLLLAALVALASSAMATALGRSRRLGELKTAFIAGVSHDLRTPLAGILLLAENLESGRVRGDRAREYHRRLRREAERLGRMVDDVLDFARIERGASLGVSREAVELGPLLAECAEELRRHCERAGIELRVEWGELPLEGMLDGNALRRMLWNLVENALHHSGSAIVELAAHGDGHRLTVEVTDRGRGIPPGKRQAIFQPHLQLDSGSRAGSGLGLSIVRALARAHGGDVRAEEPGEGSGARFVLTLSIEEAWDG